MLVSCVCVCVCLCVFVCVCVCVCVQSHLTSGMILTLHNWLNAFCSFFSSVLWFLPLMSSIGVAIVSRGKPLF